LIKKFKINLIEVIINQINQQVEDYKKFFNHQKTIKIKNHKKILKIKHLWIILYTYKNKDKTNFYKNIANKTKTH